MQQRRSHLTSGAAAVLAAGLLAALTVTPAGAVPASRTAAAGTAQSASTAQTAGTARPAATGAAAADVTVRTSQRDQVINGFGITEAFREPVISTLPAAEIQQIGNDLFSTSDGAGFSIVRFGLGSATDPGDPIQGPGDVADQVWLGQLAEQFGVSQFYADAWSAPALFKTNQSLDNGGFLCGSPGESCVDGDFRQAYADWLAAEAKGFADQGIPLKAVGFVNESEIGPVYASMLMTPAQAADFVPVLGKALAAQHLPTTVACCDAEGWLNATGFDGAQAYTQAVMSNPQAARYIGIITGHGYTSPPDTPLTSKRPVWETEWSDATPWDPAWNDGTSGDGLTWAANIQNGLTEGNLDGFFYYWGASASTANSGLIQVLGPTVNLSKRYWAYTAFARYIRPGAVRVGASSSASGLQVSAFRNTSGSVVVEVLNTSPAAQPVSVQGLSLSGASAFVTDETDSLTPESAGSGLQAPPSSLTTIVVPAR